MKPYTMGEFLSGQFHEFCTNPSSLVFHNQIFSFIVVYLYIFVGQLKVDRLNEEEKKTILLLLFCASALTNIEHHLPYGSCNILRFNHEKWQVIEMLSPSVYQDTECNRSLGFPSLSFSPFSDFASESLPVYFFHNHFTMLLFRKHKLISYCKKKREREKKKI